MKHFKKLTHNNTLFISVVLVLIAIFSLIFCLFLYFYNNKQDIKNATLILSYSDNSSDLVVDNSMPITDVVGKQLTFTPNQTKYGYSEFTVSANFDGMKSIDYEIYAIQTGVSLELPSDYVKVYLTDGHNDLPFDDYRDKIPTYHDLKVARTNPAGKKIYSGTLKENEVKTFRLCMWLADTYPITTEIRNFKVNLYVRIMD